MSRASLDQQMGALVRGPAFCAKSRFSTLMLMDFAECIQKYRKGVAGLRSPLH